MARFFIDRPIFAWVIAIMIVMAGAIALTTLPVAQFPSIAPPAVSMTVNYPGASAETVQNTVVQVIEQQLSGLDHLLYFSAESDKDGSVVITLYFAQGTNPDVAQVQVQNKLALAEPRLPAIVQNQGIRVAKATRNFLMLIGFSSSDGHLAGGDISDFIASNIQDAISRTPGVGDYQVFGTQHAMRIWLDPIKLNAYGLMPSDVISAIQSQNVQVAAGELGGLPASNGQQLNATVIGPSYLQTPDDFRKILLKVDATGARVVVGDVARVAIGNENYATSAKYNGQIASAMAVKLAPGANALDTVAAVKQTIEKLRPIFPPGVDVFYPYDTSPFVLLSIEEVVKTLLEAIALVFVIMFIFLQNFRATLVPTIAIPVVLFGTCGVLAAAGYSINTLTLFGMVLAIGLLVDDAIVVVENVERVMTEDKLQPKEATRRSMDQITEALVGIALVLSAVFLPMAFFGGSTGVIFRQFAITIVSSMVLSVLVALIFTPALCATLLRAPTHGHGPQKGFAGWFNRNFERMNNGYSWGARFMVHRPWRFMAVFAALTVAMAFIYFKIPSGFLPDEDQGFMFVQVVAPPGATSARTQAVLDEAAHYLLTEEKDSVEGVFEVNGFSFGGRGQNSGLAFVKLKPFIERPDPSQRAQAIAGRAMKRFSQFKDALAFAFAPPAVLELGNATGFDFQLQDQGNVGHAALMAARNQLLGLAAQDKRLVGVRPNGLNDEPQYSVVLDREKANALGVTTADINATLSTAWGSSYVDDFLDRGRVKRVYIQGDTQSRMAPEDFGTWYVRNKLNQMVPFTAFAHGQWTYGSPKLERYNGVSSVEILGSPAPGLSTGDALAAMQELAAQLPPGIGFSWTGLSYEERQSGSQAGPLYAISLTVVFLCLAALYESWSIPTAVLMVVPLGVLGAVIATLLRGMNNDVYFQVGLLTTIGLSAKNAILIVAFAKEEFDQGATLIDAALHAARQRLRPILMTSLAFVFGVLPLALAHGVGAGGQNAIGTGVIGGMLSATVLAVFFVPVFFVLILKLVKVKPRKVAEPSPEAAALPHVPPLSSAAE